jgi:hypothetical protein
LCKLDNFSRGGSFGFCSLSRVTEHSAHPNADMPKRLKIGGIVKQLIILLLYN